MKRLIVAFALLMAAPAAYAAPCADEAALRDLKTRIWPGYYRNQDVEGLSRFLDDDFRVIDSEGVAETKPQVLAWVRTTPWQPSNFRYDVQTVVCPADDVAIIAGQGSFDTEAGRQVYTSSNVLVRKDGRWRAVLSHVSGVR